MKTALNHIKPEIAYVIGVVKSEEDLFGGEHDCIQCFLDEGGNETKTMIGVELHSNKRIAEGRKRGFESLRKFRGVELAVVEVHFSVGLKNG